MVLVGDPNLHDVVGWGNAQSVDAAVPTLMFESQWEPNAYRNSNNKMAASTYAHISI